MKKDFSILSSDKINAKTDDNVINLVLRTIKKNKQVLIFNNSKRSSEKTANSILKHIENLENKKELEIISNKILNVLSHPTKQCEKLANCIKYGVAFHHSGLLSQQRHLIEKYFKKGLIKVISSTPTLAAGLNLPAYKVIIKDYKRYSQRGMADIPVLEFHQMAGRAGRPGIENVGHSVLCVNSEVEKSRLIPKYIFGESEEILSKLAVEPTLKMYILSLISMNIINSKDEIKNFFANTLYAFQYEDIQALNYNVFRIIEVLKDYNFISLDDDYYMATQLGKKISQLYLNPDTANYFIENLDKFVSCFNKNYVSKYEIISLINFLVNTLEMKPLFRTKSQETQIYKKKLEDLGDSLIVKFDPFESDFDSFLFSLKTTDILFSWIDEVPEDIICEKYSITPGELNYKIEVIDWLLYSLEEIAYLKKENYFKNVLSKLRIRFKFGVREDLIQLVKLKGVGRVKARNLSKLGFRTLNDLRIAQILSLKKIVGEKLALRIKEQITNIRDEKNQKTLEEVSFLNKKTDNFDLNVDVSDDEIEVLITNYEEFERDKKNKNMRLTDYF